MRAGRLQLVKEKRWTVLEVVWEVVVELEAERTGQAQVSAWPVQSPEDFVVGIAMI